MITTAMTRAITSISLSATPKASAAIIPNRIRSSTVSPDKNPDPFFKMHFLS